MAQFFSYDNGKHKHRIHGIAAFNEKDEVVGYRPVVDRFDENAEVSVVEQISDQHPQLKWKIFSTNKLARDFAIDFFCNLPTP